MAELSGHGGSHFQIPQLRRGKQADSCEFKGVPIYISGSKPAIQVSRKRWGVNNRKQVWRHKAVMPAVHAVGTRSSRSF